MQKEKRTIRLSMDEIELINSYPGKNFTNKMRTLLTVHMLKMDGVEGEDLKEKYEFILKEYLEEYEPAICDEINMRKKELKCYLDTLEDIRGLQQLVDELKEAIALFQEKSKEYLEKKVASCVVVRKKQDVSKKN